MAEPTWRPEGKNKKRNFYKESLKVLNKEKVNIPKEESEAKLNQELIELKKTLENLEDLILETEVGSNYYIELLNEINKINGRVFEINQILNNANYDKEETPCHEIDDDIDY